MVVLWLFYGCYMVVGLFYGCRGYNRKTTKKQPTQSRYNIDNLIFKLSVVGLSENRQKKLALQKKKNK